MHEHTCHAACPCHTGGRPAPDNESVELLQPGATAAQDARSDGTDEKQHGDEQQHRHRSRSPTTSPRTKTPANATTVPAAD